MPIRFSRGMALFASLRTNVLQVGATGTPIKGVATGTASLDPAEIGAAARGSVTFTITGAAAGDLIVMQPPTTLEATLLYCGCSVASGTVTVNLFNSDDEAVNGSARDWRYTWIDLT